MEKLIIAMPGNEEIAAVVSSKKGIALAKTEVRRFPDGESYVRFLNDVKRKSLYIVCTLHRPDEQFLPLYFLARGARESGAGKIILIAPYLCYLRQDKVFEKGEVLTSAHFASLLSTFLDGIITVDPHLHRYSSLSEIYNVPTRVKHSTEQIAGWIGANVKRPLLIGPDSESRQWVAKLAARLDVPFLILQKKRYGDRDIEIEIPDVENYPGHIPVLLDDIVSTGKTMVQSIRHLSDCGMPAPVCIAVHAVFAPGAYEELEASGAAQIVSCNTIPHPSNKIDITDLLTETDDI